MKQCELLILQVKPSKMKVDDLMRTSMMVMSVARRNDQQSIIRSDFCYSCTCFTCSARGMVTLQDLAGLGTEHLSLFNIATIKKLIKVTG